MKTPFVFCVPRGIRGPAARLIYFIIFTHFSQPLFYKKCMKMQKFNTVFKLTNIFTSNFPFFLEKIADLWYTILVIKFFQRWCDVFRGLQ